MSNLTTQTPNNLTVIEQKIFNDLPVSLKSYAAARIGQQPISEMNDNLLRRNCNEIITIAFSEGGQFETTPEMLEFQRTALFNEIRGNARFGMLTIEEVRNAFKMGIRGEFGPYYGICAKTYNQFLKSYFDKKERAESMRVFLAECNKPFTTEKPIAATINESINSVIKAFEEYKETKQMPFSASSHYVFLRKFTTLVNWSNDERNQLAEEAKVLYVAELKAAVLKRHLTTENYNIIVKNLDTNPTYVKRIMAHALKKVYEILIKNNANLNELLNGND